jgi:ABC-2 type transport system permease protein
VSTYFKSIGTYIEFLGMENHFKSLSRGVVDSRDVLYFTSLTFLFLQATVTKLKSFQP